MKSLFKTRLKQPPFNKQRGVVLFFALIALVVMSLAAVALIRSVDTSSIISGNLAFQQSAASGGDAGIEAAIAALVTMQASVGTTDPLVDGTHPFNVSAPANGYYSFFDPAVDVTKEIGINWDAGAGASASAGTDASGNRIRYIIQRMCRINAPNQPANIAGCLPSGAVFDLSEQDIKDNSNYCKIQTCPPLNSPTQIRVTVRTAGSKGTVSFLQAFIY